MSIDTIGIRISGPLAGFAEGYGAELTQLGYAPASVRLQTNKEFLYREADAETLLD